MGAPVEFARLLNGLARWTREVLSVQSSDRLHAARSIALAAIFAPALALQSPAHGPASSPSEDQQTLTVAADGSGTHKSIQAALDAAPEGATVRIGPGTYEERLTLSKRLTLEGAGWERTRVSMPYADLAALQVALQEEVKKATDSGATDVKAIAERFWREHGPVPVVRIQGAPGVVVRGISFAQPGKADEGSVQPSSVLELESTQTRLEDCAVLGSPASGVAISGASEVEIRRCLVAGVHATGIAISGAEPKVLVSECEVRNCRHRGITVGGNSSTTIERCRISGSAWHGIRYDDAAPKVVGNLIHENERCGIYASGATRAEVRGNLFFKNGMTGISCWSTNADRIEGNTFVEDQRTSVEVLGAAARPSIRRNVFFSLSQAVALGNIGSEAENSKTTGELDLADNLFWQVERKAVGPTKDPGTVGELEVALANGNREEDPRFLDPTARDFRLAPGSPARSAGIGAADPLLFQSTWATQPEEDSVTSLRTKKQQLDASTTSVQDAWRIANPWIEELTQIRDRGKRDLAVGQLRSALRSTDAVQRHAALIAFVQTREATYDRKAFRDLLLSLCASETGAAQVQAFYALHGSDPRPGDEAVLLQALQNPSPEMVTSGVRLLTQFFDGRIEGAAAEAALRLLADPDESKLREVFGGFWGATVAPEVQQRLLELAERPSLRHDAIYFGLSTLKAKSRPVVEFLVATLEDPDFNNWQQALWGLGQGVAEPDQSFVADRLVVLFEEHGHLRMRSDVLGLLAKYGNDSNLPALRKLAENPLLSERLRTGVQETIQAIEAR
jgi:nitrous oxidase accessory protein NosD